VEGYAAKRVSGIMDGGKRMSALFSTNVSDLKDNTVGKLNEYKYITEKLANDPLGYIESLELDPEFKG
jgi:hypothetical protein